MPIDPECFTGFRVVSPDGELYNVEYVEDGEIAVTFGATDATHAQALKDALEETAWIEIAKT